MKNNSHAKSLYLTLLIGFSQLYAWATTYYLPATLINIVPEETGHSSLAIIGGFSWALLIGGLFAPRIGAWIEKEGGRRPLALGSLCMGLGLILLSEMHGLIVWYLGWSVIGLGMALGLFNAAFATMGRLYGHEAKRLIIRITLISGFATLCWPIMSYLLQSFSWRTMVLFFAIPHLLLWAPLFFFTIPRHVPLHDDTSDTAHLVAEKKVKLVFYLLASYAILRSIVGTTISVDILTMFQGIGLTVAAAALCAAWIGPSQIMGRLIEMSIGRNFNPLYSSLFWTAVLPLSIFILLFIGTSASIIFAIAYGMSNGVLSITMGILPMILFGTKGYAKRLGQLALPVLIAQAATPLLVDPLIGYWSANSLFMLAGILGILALLSLMFLTLVSSTKRVKK